MDKEKFKQNLLKAEGYIRDLDYMYLDKVQLKMFSVLLKLYNALKELED